MRNNENSDRIIKAIEVQLEPTERLHVADEIGELVREIEERKKAFQLATAHHKSLISSLQNKQDTLLEVLASNTQERDIECFPQYDYSAGIIRLISVESGEVVEERELTAQEKQMTVHNFPKNNSGSVEQVHDDPETPPVPRCHMKPMDEVSSDPKRRVYRCSSCGSEKTVKNNHQQG